MVSTFQTTRRLAGTGLYKVFAKEKIFFFCRKGIIFFYGGAICVRTTASSPPIGISGRITRIEHRGFAFQSVFAHLFTAVSLF